MDIFNELLDNADINLMKLMKAAVEQRIVKTINENKVKMPTADINEFVTYKESYLPEESSVEFQGLLADLEDIHLDKTSKSGIETAWLSSANQSYSWMSSQGPVHNQPKDINDSKFIKQIMENINSEFDLKLNSCLVSYYSNKKVTNSLHADDEPTMDNSQPICIVSLGAHRSIQFYRKSQHHSAQPHHIIGLKSGSLCSMLKGCQDYFKHRIPSGEEDGHRYSLSFRRIRSTEAPSTPVKHIVSLIENMTLNSTSSIGSPTPSKKHTDADNVICQSNNNSTNPHISVLFGTSITTKLDEARLAHGRRKCINISNSGDTIHDISKRVDAFFEKHDTTPLEIEKVIFSFGTNDIRFRKGIHHMKKPILELIAKTKLYFPREVIYFQSLLPIRIKNNFIASNFINFNKLLFELCIANKCLFIDIFTQFIDHRGYSINEFLYIHDGIHLNHRGTVILAHFIRYAINKDRFNPLVY